MKNTTSCAARIALATLLVVVPTSMGAQQSSNAVTSRTSGADPSGSDPQFKVRLDFNRWHDVAELKSDFQKLEKAFPKLLKLSSLGKSHGGRDIVLMTINNP